MWQPYIEGASILSDFYIILISKYFHCTYLLCYHYIIGIQEHISGISPV